MALFPTPALADPAVADALARVSRERLATDTAALAAASPDQALAYVEQGLLRSGAELRRFARGHGIEATLSRRGTPPHVHVLMAWEAPNPAISEPAGASDPRSASPEVAATLLELARVLSETDFAGSVHFAVSTDGAGREPGAVEPRAQRPVGVLAFDRAGFEFMLASEGVPEVGSGVCLEGELPRPAERALVAVGHSGSKALLASFAESARRHAPALDVSSQLVVGDGGCLATRSKNALVPLWHEGTPVIQLVPLWRSSTRHDRERPLALTRAALATVLPLVEPIPAGTAGSRDRIGPLAVVMGLLMGVGLWGLRRRLAEESNLESSR